MALRRRSGGGICEVATICTLRMPRNRATLRFAVGGNGGGYTNSTPARRKMGSRLWVRLCNTMEAKVLTDEFGITLACGNVVGSVFAFAPYKRS